LHEPGQNAIWSDGVLYLFAWNTDSPMNKRQASDSFIDDVYLLDTSNILLIWNAGLFERRE